VSGAFANDDGEQACGNPSSTGDRRLAVLLAVLDDSAPSFAALAQAWPGLTKEIRAALRGSP